MAGTTRVSGRRAAGDAATAAGAGRRDGALRAGCATACLGANALHVQARLSIQSLVPLPRVRNFTDTINCFPSVYFGEVQPKQT